MSIKDSSISENVAEYASNTTAGGGLYVDGKPATGSTSVGTVEIIGSTFAYNTSRDLDTSSSHVNEAGGIYLYRVANSSIINSTISHNSSDDLGGGLRLNNTDPVVLRNSTIAYNESRDANAGGLYVATNSSVVAHNTIIAENTAATSDDDIFGMLSADSGYNLLGPGVTNEGIANYVLSAGESAGLAPLGDYGGIVLPSGNVVQTHALLNGSPAIDAGSNARALAADGTTMLSFDQRGLARKTDHLGDGVDTVDIGATESLEKIIVDSRLDESEDTDGKNSLREALTHVAADASRGAGRIVFDPLLADGIHNIDDQLNITTDVEIIGLGADQLTVSAGGIVGGPSKRAFFVEPGVEATIEGVTITGGANADYGGGVYNDGGNLTVRSVTLTRNHVASRGAAIYSVEGNLQVIESQISSNEALSGGGGIYSMNGPFSITDSEVTQNSGKYGGGIYVNTNDADHTLEIIGSSITNNESFYNSGAGIYATKPAEVEDILLTINDTEIRGNQAATVGGGIVLGLNANLTNTVISDNHAGGETTGHHGGGIYSTAGDLVLHRVTMNGNTAYKAVGGAIYKNQGFLSISESELKNNTAQHGGGIYSREGSLEIANSEVSDNEALSGGGGGIYSLNGPLSVVDSEMSQNRGAYGGGICVSTNNEGHTLEIVGSIITDNEAVSSSGAGIYATKPAETGNVLLTISDTEIRGNRAATVGGGIALTQDRNAAGGVNATLTNTIIADNHAGRTSDGHHGGGIYS